MKPHIRAHIAFVALLAGFGLSRCFAAQAILKPDTAPAQALTIAPACPNLVGNPATKQWESEPFSVRYDGTVDTAGLRTARALTLHVATLHLSVPGTVQDFTMERQQDGTWLASVTLTDKQITQGYAIFDVEDQDHNIDTNHGQYWDKLFCMRDLRTPTGLGLKAQSYDGHSLAPGFQRTADPARAIAIMRDDFAAYPNNFADLFWIWNFETHQGKGSAADWDQVSRELDEVIQKDATVGMMYRPVMGFVTSNQSKLNPSVLARFRAAIIAMPETVPPGRIQGDRWQPLPRTPQWNAIIAHEVNFLLSELDLPPLSAIADPHYRGAAYEAYTKKYADCGVNCSEVARGFGSGLAAYAEANDLDGAQRIAATWMDWDPKNPDPPATLAKAYLKANKRLPEALELVNKSADLLAPITEATAKQASATIRANGFFTIHPFAQNYTQGKESLKVLRGQIEDAMSSQGTTTKMPRPTS